MHVKKINQMTQDSYLLTMICFLYLRTQVLRTKDITEYRSPARDVASTDFYYVARIRSSVQWYNKYSCFVVWNIPYKQIGFTKKTFNSANVKNFP